MVEDKNHLTLAKGSRVWRRVRALLACLLLVTGAWSACCLLAANSSACVTSVIAWQQCISAWDDVLRRWYCRTRGAAEHV